MSTLILLRHGQSTADAAEAFTSWTDVALPEIGEHQAPGTMACDQTCSAAEHLRMKRTRNSVLMIRHTVSITALAVQTTVHG